MKIQDRYEYDPQKDLLGKGGFARVFRAQDTLLHREVALKVFSNAGTHQYSVLAEIRKVIGLEHPNLLRYYDVVMLEGQNPLGEAEQTQIGVMELANAGDLKDYAKANPNSPLLYKLLKDVLLGLEYLHSKGIIHRDLKAQNILLVKQDGVLTAKISDFGISKDTGSGGQSSSMMVGTIEYMAPEQFSPAKYGIDGKVSSNLDLWSFGIMVHELLTETTPFGSRDGETTAEQIMAQILSTELPDGIDRLPEPYKSVVKRCLVANAKERIRRASELVSYFEEPGKTLAKSAAQGTQVDDNATKIYPKAAESTIKKTALTCTQPEGQTRLYPSSEKEVIEGNDSQLHSALANTSVSETPNSSNKIKIWAAVGTLALLLSVAGIWGAQYFKEQELVRINKQTQINAKEQTEKVLIEKMGNRCKGSSEVEKCIDLERRLAQETPEQRAKQQAALESERRSNWLKATLEPERQVGNSAKISVDAKAKATATEVVKANPLRETAKKEYREVDFGFNNCSKLRFEKHVHQEVSLSYMEEIANKANAQGFTYQPKLRFGNLIVGKYPENCRAPKGESWPLYLLVK